MRAPKTSLKDWLIAAYFHRTLQTPTPASGYRFTLKKEIAWIDLPVKLVRVCFDVVLPHGNCIFELMGLPIRVTPRVRGNCLFFRVRWGWPCERYLRRHLSVSVSRSKPPSDPCPGKLRICRNRTLQRRHCTLQFIVSPSAVALLSPGRTASSFELSPRFLKAVHRRWTRVHLSATSDEVDPCLQRNLKAL